METKVENGQSAAKQIERKPIKGWEGLYEITNDGQVYSIKRNTYLKPRLSMDGYRRVCLCDNNKRREYRIARLVAEAFIENTENKSQVNHKDYNRQNDCMDNLEWVTNYENALYSYNQNKFNNPGTYKAYTFTNVYNGKAFTIVGIKNVAKQFHCTAKNFMAILTKYNNTGAFVKQGIFKGLRVDSEYLKVQRLSQSGVDSSESKCKES